MKEQQKTYFFIDESGDPAFFAKGNKSIVGIDGFKPLLLIGAVVIKMIHFIIPCHVSGREKNGIYTQVLIIPMYK